MRWVQGEREGRGAGGRGACGGEGGGASVLWSYVVHLDKVLERTNILWYRTWHVVGRGEGEWSEGDGRGRGYVGGDESGGGGGETRLFRIVAVWFSV